VAHGENNQQIQRTVLKAVRLL